MSYLFSAKDLVKEATPPKAGTPEATLDKYLARTIRRVTLFFSQAEYDTVLRKAKYVADEIGVDNHTELFKRLLDEHDQS